MRSDIALIENNAQVGADIAFEIARKLNVRSIFSITETPDIEVRSAKLIEYQ